MALPKYPITPIPNDEPDAVPSLWNTRYVEIDQNFNALDSRLVARESELNAARAPFANLNARLSDIDSRVGTSEPEYQEALHFEVRHQMELVALAHVEIAKSRRMRQQQGEVVLRNRGVNYGLTVSKSVTATRNLHLAAGQFFLNGRMYSVNALENAASVQANASGQTMTCVAYVRLSGNAVSFHCSLLGQEAPDDGVALYRLSVPAGSTEVNDQYLASVTLTDVRRVEADWPQVQVNPPQVTVALGAALPNAGYVLRCDVVSAVGGVISPDAVLVDARANNGFRFTLASHADDVVVRWSVMNLEV
ncbi:hypothetical protein [Chrysiogenes arsenatis]|uniref:hypothetical protein n=1 Tax=Chrysiogenes arsenatis TaxID=309797 RepID=UPI0004026167|nr:hypothetical protein [Chrysiogenes arsenatis]